MESSEQEQAQNQPQPQFNQAPAVGTLNTELSDIRARLSAVENTLANFLVNLENTTNELRNELAAHHKLIGGLLNPDGRKW